VISTRCRRERVGATNADENLALIRETGHARFPVVDGAEGGRIVGILLVRDIFNALLAGEDAPCRFI